MFIDVHCHLTDENYEGEGALEGLLDRAREAGVTRLITSGYDLTSSIAAKELAERI